MKNISKKIWFTLSVTAVVLSTVFAWKKPVQKEKASHIVVDRLVNQLVCSTNVRSDNTGKRFPRGIVRSSVTAQREAKRTSDDYTLFSSHKSIMGRPGKQRGDNWKPAGGDYKP